MKSLYLGALALAVVGISACGIDAEIAEGTTDSVAVAALRAPLVSSKGVTVKATYQEVVTGTPTYGYPATTPLLTVHVEIDDSALRSVFPAFDGLERPAVLVPRPKDGGVVFDTVGLRYSGQSRRGYYAEIPIDLYDNDSLWNVDWATLRDHGVAVRLDTNVGVIWGQETGFNFPVVRR